MVRLKGDIVNKKDINIPIFQFLMVRLKDLKTAQERYTKENFNSLWCD